MRILFLIGSKYALIINPINFYSSRCVDDALVIQHDTYVGDTAFCVIKKGKISQLGAL